MEAILMSLGSKPASQGIGDVILWGIMVLGMFALIYAVLEIMNYVHKKKGGDEKSEDVQEKKPDALSFPQVLSEEMKKFCDSDEDKRV